MIDFVQLCQSKKLSILKSCDESSQRPSSALFSLILCDNNVADDSLICLIQVFCATFAISSTPSANAS